jgi:hypothetical protein
VTTWYVVLFHQIKTPLTSAQVAAYGEYSASATGGNGFCRDFLAGIAALYATPFYTNIKPGTKWQLPIPSFILAAASIPLVIAPYVFYFHGAWFRNRSKYASQLAEKRAEGMAPAEEMITL